MCTDEVEQAVSVTLNSSVTLCLLLTAASTQWWMITCR